MENPLSIFDFNDNPLRVTTRGGLPWFVAADVCRALHIKHAPSAIEALDEDERMTVANDDSHSGQRGGAQSFNLISEAGLYRLIFKSRKPEAKAFQKWVFEVVLPAIRKTGSYTPLPPAPAPIALPAPPAHNHRFPPTGDWEIDIALSLRALGFDQKAIIGFSLEGIIEKLEQWFAKRTIEIVSGRFDMRYWDAMAALRPLLYPRGQVKSIIPFSRAMKTENMARCRAALQRMPPMVENTQNPDLCPIINWLQSAAGEMTRAEATRVWRLLRHDPSCFHLPTCINGAYAGADWQD